MTMARRSRLNLAGVPQHLIQRGNNRQATFFAEEDYHCYRRWLADAAKKYDCCIYAYDLMTNHVHLLASTARPGEYFWSSYRNHAFGITDSLLSSHERYESLGKSDEGRQQAYRDLFRTELDTRELAEIRDTAKRGWPLGGSRFKDEIERTLNCVVSPPKRGRPIKRRSTMLAEQQRAYYRYEKLH